MKQPPSYSSIVQVDEQVDLPSYTPSLHRYDLVLYKRELKSPSVPITEWSWHLSIIELNSTQLNTYKVDDHYQRVSKLLKKILDFKSKVSSSGVNKDKKFLNDPKFRNNQLIEYLLHHENSDQSIPYEIIKPYIGDRVTTFTLQYSSIGVAKDYIPKRKNIFRLRLELEQYLMVFLNKPRFIKFNSDFKIARCISMDVDDRVIKDNDLGNLETLLRFKGWQGMVCLPWDEGCERKFASLKKYEKLFFYFDEATLLKTRQKSCKSDVLKYKRFVIRDCGIEEYG